MMNEVLNSLPKNGTITIPVSDYLKLIEIADERRELCEKLHNIADSIREDILQSFEDIGLFRCSSGETFPDNFVTYRAVKVLEMLGEELNIPQEEIEKAIIKHDEWEKERREILGE